jgi:hypothetical protein
VKILVNNNSRLTIIVKARGLNAVNCCFIFKSSLYCILSELFLFNAFLSYFKIIKFISIQGVFMSNHFIRSFIIFLSVNLCISLFLCGCSDEKKQKPEPSMTDLAKSDISQKAESASPEPKDTQNADTQQINGPTDNLKIPENLPGTGAGEPGVKVVNCQLGPQENMLAGSAQDTQNLTDGFPPAYDVDEKGNIHVLDSVNKRIVIFASSASENLKIPKSTISLLQLPGLKDVSRELSDISGPVSGSYAILDKTAGIVFVIDTAGKVKWYVAGQKTAGHIYLHHDGRLFVSSSQPGEEDKTVVFDSNEKPLNSFTGTFIKPWLSPDNKLFYLDNSSETGILVSLDILKNEQKEFCRFIPKEGMEYAGADILAVTSGGFPVVALLSVKAMNPGTRDERQIFNKSIVSYDSKGKMVTSIDMSQPNMNLGHTPRLHRLGRNDKLYTLRIKDNFYCLYERDL